MFYVRDVSGKEIIEAIDACAYEHEPGLIRAEGLFITPLPPVINLKQSKEKISIKSIIKQLWKYLFKKVKNK